jgi:hypothetical protein
LNGPLALDESVVDLDGDRPPVESVSIAITAVGEDMRPTKGPVLKT